MLLFRKWKVCVVTNNDRGDGMDVVKVVGGQFVATRGRRFVGAGWTADNVKASFPSLLIQTFSLPK